MTNNSAFGFIKRAAGGSLLLRLFAMVAGFVTSWLLARWLGADDYGIFTYIFTWFTLLGGLASVGLENLAVRETAKLKAQNNASASKGLFLFGSALVGGLALLFCLLFWWIIHGASYSIGKYPFLYAWFDTKLLNHNSYLPLLYFSLAAVPFYALTNLHQAFLRGKKLIIPGQFSEMLIKPAVFLMVLLAVFLYDGNTGLTLRQAVFANIGAIAAAWLAGELLLFTRFLPDFKNRKASFQNNIWLKSAGFFLLTGGTGLINLKTDVLMLGAITGAETTGIYNIALRMSELLRLLLVVANTALSPMIAQAFARNELRELQHLLTRSIRLVFVVALPTALVLMLMGGKLLGIFGPEFTQAHWALIILCVGQLFNTAFGSVGNILNMGGFERYTFMGLGISTLINIALNALMIPLWNLTGAAIATAASLLVWNVLLSYFVRRETGLAAGVWGKR